MTGSRSGADGHGGALLARVKDEAGQLDPAVRSRMETSFGTPFGDVVVHSGSASARTTDDLGATAFTVGRHIVFGAGRYDPASATGRTLLAHELAHVVQQGGRAPSGTTPDSSGERAANAAAGRAMSGGAAGIAATAVSGPQLQEKKDREPPRQALLTPDDLWKLAQDQRGFESTSGGQGDEYRSSAATVPAGSLEVDTAGNPVARGVRVGKGWETVATLQVLDAQGRQVAVARGIFYTGGPEAHAERVAIERLEPHMPTGPDKLTGGTLVVVGDQEICTHCRAALIETAQRWGLSVIDPYEPTRAKMRGTGNASPKTSSRSSMMAGMPALSVQQQAPIEVPPAAGGGSAPGGSGPAPVVVAAATGAKNAPKDQQPESTEKPQEEKAPAAVKTTIEENKRTLTASSYTSEDRKGTRTVAGGRTTEASTTKKSTLAADDGVLTGTFTTKNARTVTEAETGETTTPRSTTRTTSLSSRGLTSTREMTSQTGNQVTTKSGTSGISRGEGQLGYTGSSSTTTGTVDAEGKLTRGTTRKDTGSLGVVAGPGEAGIGGNLGSTVTDTHSKGVTTGTSATLGGKVVVTCTEEPDSYPPQYRVGITIDLSVGFSGTAGLEREAEALKTSGGTAKLTLSAGWARTGTFTHLMSEADTVAYLGALRDHKEDGAHRELAIIRLAADGAMSEAGSLLGKLNELRGSASAARDQQEGESAGDKVTTTLGAGLDATGTGKAGAKVGLKLGYSVTGSIGRTVSKEKGKVVVRLEVLSKTSKSGSGSLGSGVVGMSAGRTSAVSTGQGATFTLDPDADKDFDAHYAAIMAPETVDQVRAVAQANPTLLTSSTITTGEESSTTVGADVAGFGLEFEKGGSMTEAVTTAPEGVTKRLTATATSGVTAKAPVGPKVTSRQVETFDAKIGPDAKATAEASTRRSDTDLGATAEALRTAPIATLTGAVTGKTSLLKERSETSGTKVDDDDFQRLTGLAADATAWERSFLNGEGMVNDAFGEWRATRSRVLAANSNREEISRALAEFQRGGPRRSGVIQAAYRMAGAGIRFDFPQVLERQRSVYDELVVGSPITGIRALSDVGRRQEAADRATTVTTRLNDLQSAIIARQAEVSDPGVLSEMLRRVGTRISQVNAEARTLKKAATPQVGTGGPAASQPPTADTEAVKEDAAVTIRTTTATLGSLQEREKAIMDFVDSEYGHWYRKSDAIVISKKLGALREMYSQWRLELERLRTAYAAHGDAPTAADKYAPNQSRYDAQYKRFQVW